MCVHLFVCVREIEIKPVRVPVCDCVVLYALVCALGVCCSVVQFVAVWCSLLQCGAVCCSVVQFVAVGRERLCAW